MSTATITAGGGIPTNTDLNLVDPGTATLVSCGGACYAELKSTGNLMCGSSGHYISVMSTFTFSNTNLIGLLADEITS